MSAVVVVESPAKAKTIEKYLGKGYKVLASYGHVRAFPKKDGSVDPDNDFAITYQIIDDKKKRLDDIGKALKRADTLILASDLDREGEAIAWHVAEVMRDRGLLKDKTVQRITFNEITKKAITEAVENPSEVDMKMVDAQQARSALDYLVGFTLSPLLWRKIRSGLSAGRVQSVALRLICEREQLIRDFKPKEFWTIDNECSIGNDPFQAQLHAVDGKTLSKFAITDGVNAKVMARRVAKASFKVSDVQKKQARQQPSPPFITTTLQMDASRKLGFTARKTMQVAQKLYEGIEVDGEPVGLITYMRTDSVTLSEDAIAEMRSHISSDYGSEYLPEKARRFKTKSKNAQEAHEAIRPSSILRTPAAMKTVLDADALKLYSLIWKRALASQMAPALLDQVRADIDSGDLLLRATGSTLAFPGFRKLYIEGTDEPGKDDNDRLLPVLAVGDAIAIKDANAKQHFTEPKPRFSEATLVKELEANGIGRPSTYASILNVLRAREYVDMEKKRFVPTDTGDWVNKFLVASFGAIVDPKFTASVEDKLDAVARGETGWKPVLREFWGPFKEAVDLAATAERPSEESDEVCPECGKPMAIKLGKYGKFLACTGYPECKVAKPLNGTAEQAEPELSDQKCDKCGELMAIKAGRYGKFLGCSAYPACKNIQPLEKPVDTGIPCPTCGKGTFLEKKSRRGKIFYSCSCYPKCTNALWNEPIDKPCPQCNAPYVTVKKTKRRGTEHVCVSEGCGWKEQVDLPEAA
ncbi:type I DNA topoisomerase [Mariprofundus sp. NF]|uniref:type I DNA topoisomerase n=1 Tax=Mariprofundus sp. NF TaxID=2608716 RepID=UPI0015A0FA14|nr:type I DNA topoisomerase [Mariprofundus sp. NF]NWF38975.1 type I DNA topoisomerase [Mariprofundus sp. NF]